MGYYTVIHTWSDSSEGCKVARREMSVNMEEIGKRGISGHTC